MTREHIQHALDVIYNQIFNQAELICFLGLCPGRTFSTIRFSPMGSTASCLHQASRQDSLRGEAYRHRWRSGLHTRALLELAGKETAGVDIFRFDAEGKVVEHWDVLQPVRPPPTTPTRCFEKNPPVAG